MRKDQTNPNRGTFYKHSGFNLQKYQGYESQGKTDKFSQPEGNQKAIIPQFLKNYILKI